MSKKFDCPSCSEKIVFAGGDSIFQNCQSCQAPVIVPSEFLYDKSEQLASEGFASLVNDRPVDVEQVTNELTPGASPPRDEDIIDPDARIEKFEIYQEKLGTDSVEAKKAVEKIVAPKDDEKFQMPSPFTNDDNSIVREVPPAAGQVKVPENLRARHPAEPASRPEQKKPPAPAVHPALARIDYELGKGDKIEAIEIFKNMFKTDAREARLAVEALARGEQIDISRYRK